MKRHGNNQRIFWTNYINKNLWNVHCLICLRMWRSFWQKYFHFSENSQTKSKWQWSNVYALPETIIQYIWLYWNIHCWTMESKHTLVELIYGPEKIMCLILTFPIKASWEVKVAVGWVQGEHALWCCQYDRVLVWHAPGFKWCSKAAAHWGYTWEVKGVHFFMLSQVAGVGKRSFLRFKPWRIAICQN